MTTTIKINVSCKIDYKVINGSKLIIEMAVIIIVKITVIKQKIKCVETLAIEKVYDVTLVI